MSNTHLSTSRLGWQAGRLSTLLGRVPPPLGVGLVLVVVLLVAVPQVLGGATGGWARGVVQDVWLVGRGGRPWQAHATSWWTPMYRAWPDLAVPTSRYK